MAGYGNVAEREWTLPIQRSYPQVWLLAETEQSNPQEHWKRLRQMEMHWSQGLQHATGIQAELLESRFWLLELGVAVLEVQKREISLWSKPQGPR